MGKAGDGEKRGPTWLLRGSSWRTMRRGSSTARPGASRETKGAGRSAQNDSNPTAATAELEARGGIEPPMKVLQTFALPLGDRAPSKRRNKTIIAKGWRGF